MHGGSGSRAGLLRPGPLRTGRESFPSSGDICPLHQRMASANLILKSSILIMLSFEVIKTWRNG
jgi:hypothetical protein